MGWIKRNLFFVIGGVVALGLLGAGGYYIYQGWSRNSDATAKLGETYGQLKGLQDTKPSPGNDRIDNTVIARQQEQQLVSWIKSAIKYYQPIPAIPSEDVTSETFKNALDRTVAALQHEAGDAGVALPPKFDFSFSEQLVLMKFAAGSLQPLATQLGEVKTIAETVFSARVNALDSIQRVRVSADDASGPAGDYVDEPVVTNGLAVITPYVVTFRCFTPELARVVSAFANSQNTFIIKSINIQPAGLTAPVPGDSAAGTPAGQPPEAAPGRFPGPSQAPATLPGKAGLPTVLKEQLLRVSLELGIVKLSLSR